MRAMAVAKPLAPQTIADAPLEGRAMHVSTLACSPFQEAEGFYSLSTPRWTEWEAEVDITAMAPDYSPSMMDASTHCTEADLLPLLNLPGSMRLGDGSIQLPNGKILSTDGAIKYRDGSIRYVAASPSVRYPPTPILRRPTCLTTQYRNSLPSGKIYKRIPTSLPNKMYPLAWLCPLSPRPPFFSVPYQWIPKHEQYIHNVPCALRLHCSLIDYILHYNASRCFPSQHDAKVSCHCADQNANTVVTDCRIFFFSIFLHVAVYLCLPVSNYHTAPHHT